MSSILSQIYFPDSETGNTKGNGHIASKSNDETEEEVKHEEGEELNKMSSTGFSIGQIKWVNSIMLMIIHILALRGFYSFLTFQFNIKLISFIAAHNIITAIGVTAGVHRFYTHRTYNCSRTLQVIHLFLYASTGQNSVYQWVRDHRLHHKYSETDADPHNSSRGFFFCHVGWLMLKRHPKFMEKNAKLDMSDIKNDALVEWFDKNFFALRMICAYILPLIIIKMVGEFTWWDALCALMFKYCIILNVIWSVNSFAHMFGYKPYDGRIKPVENWMVSLFAAGEGWHNYHHAFPWDYRASELGYFLNHTTIWLDMWAKLGHVYDRKMANPQMIETMRKKYGDMNDTCKGDHED